MKIDETCARKNKCYFLSFVLNAPKEKRVEKKEDKKNTRKNGQKIKMKKTKIKLF